MFDLCLAVSAFVLMLAPLHENNSEQCGAFKGALRQEVQTFASVFGQTDKPHS